MSPEEELQRAIFQILSSDTDLQALVDTRIFDRVTPKTPFPYISFGPATTNEADAIDIMAGDHTFQIDVWSRNGGKIACKKICSLVRAALHEIDIELQVNALVLIRVLSIRVLDEPDGLTAHGIITINAIIEDNS